MKWWKLRQAQARAGHVAQTYHDPAIAAVEDEAARAALDVMAGKIRQLEGDVYYLLNQLLDVQNRLIWTQYRPGNPFDADNATARNIVRGTPPTTGEGA